MATDSKANKLVLKVQLGQDRDAKRLVVPVRDARCTVRDLAHLIAGRFRVERVAELRSGDGFLLNQDDETADVLRDGDVILALDYTQWVQENNAAINNSIRGENWCVIEQADFKDSIKKWVSCGWASSIGKFYVRMGGYRDSWLPALLELYDPEDLLAASPKVVGRIGGAELGWEVSAELKAGTAGTVNQIVLRARSTTDAREMVKSLQFTIKPRTDKPIIKGEEKLEQSSELPEEDVSYVLPPAESLGPSYPEAEPEDKKAGNVEPPEIRGEGQLPLVMVHKGIIELDQTQQRDVGQPYDQLIQTEIEILNPSETSVVVTGWKAEYQVRKGEWAPCKLLRGSRVGFWNYRYESGTTSSATFHKKSSVKLALTASVPLTGNQMYRRRFLHHSLPNPLLVRFTLSDIDGNPTTLEIPVASKIPASFLVTREDDVRSNGGGDRKQLGYIKCDDTEVMARLHASLWYEHRDGYEETWTVRQSVGNSYDSFTLTGLKKIAFQAALEKKSEWPLESCHAEQKSLGISFDATALVDVARRRVYAIKLALRTSTSAAHATFPTKPPTSSASPLSSSS